MISQMFLDELRARVPVSAVVGRRVRLTKAGREWKGLSPFTNERTPSFFVNDHKGFFHDFSSGRHGDAITFVMEIEGVDFRQAVDHVAAIAGMAAELEDVPPTPRPAAPPPRQPTSEELSEKADRLRLARQLWTRSLPAEKSIAQNYLRARGYQGCIPATVRYLPRNGVHPPALIAAYGRATEVIRESAEPGELIIADEAVVGVHLIDLRADGSDRLRDEGAKHKRTIGKDITMPIVLAPPNDGLALDIAEGVEDALNAHQASGRGAWAAGGAGRLPGLADHIPSYIETVVISVDDNEAGRTGAYELAARLDARGIEVLLTPVGVPT
jgi:DNA primase